MISAKIKGAPQRDYEGVAPEHAQFEVAFPICKICYSDSPFAAFSSCLLQRPSAGQPVHNFPNRFDAFSIPFQGHSLGGHASLVFGARDGEVFRINMKQPRQMRDGVLRVSVSLLHSEMDIREWIAASSWCIDE